MKKYKIMAINPGSTSTKVAIFINEECVFSKNIQHDANKLKEFENIYDQFEYRKNIILDEINAAGIDLNDVDAFSGRAGGYANVVGGVYYVNELMIEDTKSGKYVKHPANLGCTLVEEFRKEFGGKAFVVNPPDTDEFQDLARITGWKGVYRESKLHALNQKEVALRYAKKNKKAYKDLNLIVAHIGGGVSVTSHRNGLMIDSNDIAQGDGPFAPTRSGQLPAVALIRTCFSGKYTERELYDKVTKSGGFVDHLGTSDAVEVTKMINSGNKYAKLVYDAFIYQIGKAIGSNAAVLHGKVDAILVTGGISHDKYVVEQLKKMCGFIAPFDVMPGEFEMEALAAGAIRVLSEEEEAKTYTGEPVWKGFDY